MRTTYHWLKERADNTMDESSRSEVNQLLDEWLNVSENILELTSQKIAMIATDYLHYTSYILLGVVWLDLASCANNSALSEISRAKQQTCEFYFRHLISRRVTHRETIDAYLLQPINVDLAVFS